MHVVSVRQRTDRRPKRSYGVAMIDNEPRPWNAPVECVKCGRRLIPLSYEIPPDDDPRGNERPALKCTGCSQTYRWHPNPGWVAIVDGE
jgi:hypothetical protein